MPNKSFKELPLEFSGRGEAKGYFYKQIKKSDFAYIYEVKAINNCIWYEVFKKKEDKRFAKIAYPKANSFGYTAWNCKRLNKALKRFNRLAKTT